MGTPILTVFLTPFKRVEGLAFVADKSVGGVKPVFEVEGFDKFCERPLPEAQWLIEPLFERDSQVILWGEPGCGKSFVALSWATAIATGQKWLGKYDVKQCPVLYCVGEGGRGMRRRGAAAQEEYGLSSIPDLHFLTLAPRLRDPKVLDEFMKLVKRIQPGFVVIDTLARSMTGDENSAEHISDWLAAAALIQHETKACVMPLHHTAKNVKKGMKPTERGSGALRGAMDTSIQVRGGDFITLTCVKQKDDIPFGDITLQLKTVLLTPASAEKKALTSAVVVPYEETIPERILSGGPQDAALRILEAKGPLTIDLWREHSEAPLSTFYRWVKKLEDEGLVELNVDTGKWRVLTVGK